MSNVEQVHVLQGVCRKAFKSRGSENRNGDQVGMEFYAKVSSRTLINVNCRATLRGWASIITTRIELDYN
jgi:hypothetical protein